MAADCVKRTRLVMLILMAANIFIDIVSFFVFFLLDLIDSILCILFKIADFIAESEWKPCCCSSSGCEEAIISSGKILVSDRWEPKVVRMISSTKIQLEDISDTLYTRPSVVSEISKSTAAAAKRLTKTVEIKGDRPRYNQRVHHGNGRPRYRINSTIVEMIQGKTRRSVHPVPRWSDCNCHKCISWSTSMKESLYVRAEGLKEAKGEEITDVLFIHGFVSSSVFWTETVFPNFSEAAKSKYRLLAIDLLGFGRSPKPTDSLYTLSEHVDMIEQSVINAYKVKSFHIVAHSLGCIIAIALAVKYPNAVKSLTLLSPPYFPVPDGEHGSQYVLRRVAPRRVWPLIAFGSSVAAWYEHISRAWCLMVCKNHRTLDMVAKQITRNRIRTFMVDGFFIHTHQAAWHTLHNIICGAAAKMDGYLDALSKLSTCGVTILHGSQDELLPLDCSLNVQSKVPRAKVKVIDGKDHLTIVIGRQRIFARELEEIWKANEP